ncbi:hypothetical protein CCR75_006938 [Bremia lactucae]|uniref:H/ACA ribonucleoprotein complex non-core subunit NAF1 n=1 Tax=Bremia lactucae TaxID=4779 RepID=A0A976IKB6_BRELC|nr:hypothetical protein CCR75_006938 [Bremia lactucae]
METVEAISDLAVAAHHADAQMYLRMSQLDSSAMDKNAKVVMTTAATDDSKDGGGSDCDSIEITVKTKLEDLAFEPHAAELSSGGSCDYDSDEGADDLNELRATIEAAMEKENYKNGPALTTEHEVVLPPVREPGVDLTNDCPIAHCGSILNISATALMITVQAISNTTLLNEGSVLCLEDRTVLGCIDEVFGPVMMPMYLIRFASTFKIPKNARVNSTVYYATEHTTYIVPEDIKHKGTDASNIFDEEADETEFSDDEAEAAAKRGGRKRNRGGAQNHGIKGTNYAPSQANGGGRGGRGGHGKFERNAVYNYSRHRASPPRIVGCSQHTPTYQMLAMPSMQTRPYGGITNYTQPQSAAYGSPLYTAFRGNRLLVSSHDISPVSQEHIVSNGYYQPLLPSQDLTSYPPHALYPHSQLQLSPQAYYCQPQQPRTVPHSEAYPPHRQSKSVAPPIPRPFYGNGQ